jgi:NitT/TauT family transport system substrate-binding protein
MLRSLPILLIALILFSLQAPVRGTAQAAPHALRVTTTLNDAGAQLFYAQEMGFFAKAGLHVEIVPINNAGAIASAVISGDLDIGQLSIPALAAAHEKGVAFVLVAPAAIYSHMRPSSALVVLKSSPIQSGAALNGKTIAVRDLTNIGSLAARVWIVKNGGDLAGIKFVEMPDAAAAAALDAGRIDAASMSEPDLTPATKANDRVLGYSYDAIAPEFLLGAYFATSAYARGHADDIRTFAQVMRQTAIWANKNPQLSAPILEKYTKSTLAPTAMRTLYSEKLTAAQVQPVIDASARFHILNATFPATDLFPES